MIGWISGRLQSNTPPWIMLEANGIGYELQVPLTTLYQLPHIGETIALHVHTHWREDGFALFGFHQLNQKILFRQLIKVNGVGPKMGLALLSQDLSSLLQSFANRDMQALTKVPGVGKKTAERLILELSDKLGDIATDNTASVQFADSNNATQITQEAIAALESLGYKPQQAKQLVNKLHIDEHSDLSNVIKQALQGMAV
jgi:Holliday junction DNA helicase RuvA